MASSSTSWTEAEQTKLEEGLVQCAAIFDLKEKWKSIAAIVGTRDARACAERFKVCRTRVCDETGRGEQSTVEDKERKAGGWWSSGWDSSAWAGWSWNDNSGWHESKWQEKEEEEEVPPEDEAERRKWEMRKQIEANKRKMQQQEEKKQKEEEKQRAKQVAEQEKKEKEKQEKIAAREKQLREAEEKERQQRAEAEEKQRELLRRQKEEDERAGFFGQKHLGDGGKGPARGRGGWAAKAAAGRGALQKQRKQEEMERKAREALEAIGMVKPSAEEEEEEEEEAAAAEEEAKLEEIQAKEEPQAKLEDEKQASSHGNGKSSAKGTSKKGDGKKGAEKGSGQKGAGKARKQGWWTKIDGECPISLIPIPELARPPFGLSAEGSSVPHYFDARFLAHFLLSSCDFINPVNRCKLTREDCVALDQHLQEHHKDQRGMSVADAFDLFELNGKSGSDSVRREATAVLQHLFHFRSARELDSRGRAVNYNDGGLTVIDDDDIQVSAAQHATASTAAALAVDEDIEAFPSLGPGAPSQAASGGKGRAWRGTAAKEEAGEAFPELPSGSGRGAGRGAAAKQRGRGAAGPVKQTLQRPKKGWGS